MIDKGLYEQKKQLAFELWDKYAKAARELKEYAKKNTPLPENLYWKAKKMEHYYKLKSVNEVYDGDDGITNYDADFLIITDDECRLNTVWNTCKAYIEESCLPITAEQWNEALMRCRSKIMENMVTISKG